MDVARNEAESSQVPIASFYQLFPDAPLPQRADKTLMGTMPLRAVRGCEPLVVASGYGWYIYPPLDFSLTWDGTNIYWRIDDDIERDWVRCEKEILPGYTEHLSGAPAHIRELCYMPFMSPAPEPGILQIWPGLLVKTKPEWSILVRPLANLPKDPAVELFDGIIETDWWFGPLLSVLRFCKTDTVFSLRKDLPYAQLQPIHRAAYNNKLLDHSVGYSDITDFPDSVWNDLTATLTKQGKTGKRASYKTEAVKKRHGVI